MKTPCACSEKTLKKTEELDGRMISCHGKKAMKTRPYRAVGAKNKTELTKRIQRAKTLHFMESMGKNLKKPANFLAFSVVFFHIFGIFNDLQVYSLYPTSAVSMLPFSLMGP